MGDLTQAFTNALAQLNLNCHEQTAEKLAGYHELLCDWNTRMNLTGATDIETALDRLYMDSLAPLKYADLFSESATLIDVGTGAGFPGMVLAIARPDLQITLLDSLQKRLNFLAAVRDDLGLNNITLVHARAEDGGHDPKLREKYDIAVARAVAPLNVLCELLLPFVKVGGAMICYKGPSAEEEIAAAKKAARIMGGSDVFIRPVSLPTQPEWQHCIVASAKAKPCDKRYPRKAGTPSRDPLGK